VSVRPAGDTSDIAFRFHDVHGEVVYESVRTQQDRNKAASTTRLGTHAASFTINGKPTFLRGISYYGALGAAEESIQRDLADVKRLGFNWIRVWATWAAFGNDVSAVDSDGQARESFLSKLQWLVAECDRQGIVVDVTLSRGNGTTGPARLQSLDAHRRAVETITQALKPYRNWYLDLANERNIRDKRFVSFEELKDLRSLVRQLDPERLVTASHAGDIGRDDLREYLVTVGVDFVSPHRPRNPKSPDQTESKSRDYLAWMQDLNRVVPLHYQEPFRRGFNPKQWEPPADAFLADLKQAIAGGAAGWCFHNGDQKDKTDAQPRRSFDLRDRRLFEQLDDEEKAVLTSNHTGHP
jgi:endo-1,4-beta-mannosidase